MKDSYGIIKLHMHPTRYEKHLFSSSKCTFLKKSTYGFLLVHQISGQVIAGFGDHQRASGKAVARGFNKEALRGRALLLTYPTSSAVRLFVTPVTPPAPNICRDIMPRYRILD